MCQFVSLPSVKLALLVLVLVACGESRRTTDDEGSGGEPSAGAGGMLAGSGGASAGMGGGAPAPNPFPCFAPTPVIDASTGFIECSNGYSYRAEAGRCPLVRRTEPVPGPADPECVYDSDCSDDPLGYCQTGFCLSGCATDADCSSATLCACGLTEGLGIGSCVSAECRSDRDCQPGFHCALIVTGTSDAARWVYACQLPADRCVSDADCPPTGPNGGDCVLSPTGRYCGGNL